MMEEAETQQFDDPLMEEEFIHWFSTNYNSVREEFIKENRKQFQEFAKKTWR